MRLETIEVKDFRSIREASLKFARVNWILGDNFSGKTSLLRAIDSALMARASKHVVNAEARSANVRLIVGVNAKVVNLEMSRFRSRTNTPIVDGRGMPRTQYVESMPSLLGVSEPVLDAVLSAGRFMELPPPVQASIVMAAAGVNHEWAEAETAFSEWCEEQKISPFELSDVITPVRLAGLALVDQIYDTAYKLRTAANREASLERHDPPVPPTDILQYVGNPGLLEGLRDEAAALADRLPRLQQTLGQLGQLEELNNGEDPAAELDSIDIDELAARGAALRALRDAIEAANSTVNSANAAFSGVKRTYDSLAKERCPFGVKCNFKTWAPEQWAEIESDLAGLKSTLDAAVASRDALAPVAKEEIDYLKGQKDRINALERKIEIRARVIEQLAGAGTDSAAVKLEVDQVAGRKDEVTRLLDMVRAHSRAVTSYQGAVERHEAAALRASRLDTVVKGFGKPIRFKMVGEVMDLFVTPMRRALRFFFGDFEFKATSEGGFSIEVMKSGMALPFDELSKSEQLMVSTAAQHAITQIAGVKLLIVDAVDTLRGSALQQFIRGLYGLSKGYETVVVASTTGRITPETSPLRNREQFPDTQLVIVENGTLRTLDQVSPKVLKALQTEG